MNVYFRKKYMIILLLSNVVWAAEDNESKSNISKSLQSNVDVNHEYKNKLDRDVRYFLSANNHGNKIHKNTSPEKMCLPISRVFLQGNTLLSSQDLNNIDSILDECIDEKDINILAREVTRLYLAKGYLAARVNFIPLNDMGELGLNVTEGIIERIEGGDRGVNPNFIFPNFIDKPLSISMLDQSIDQANKLRSNKVSVDILPGSQAGKSIIKINNDKNKPWSLTTVIDNYGYKKSDEWQARMSLAIDSPFGISDSISLNTNRTLENAKKRYKNDFTVSYAVPYGALTFRALAHHLERRSYNKLPNNIVKFNSDSQQYNFRTDYVFHRNQRQINSLNVQLEHKRANSYVMDRKVIVQSHRLTAIELGINQFRVLPRGSVNINALVKKEMPWFGYSDNNRVRYNGRFSTAKLNVNFNKNFILFKSPYQFDQEFAGQYSKNNPPNLEWLSLTDRSAIRGFSRSAQQADTGWYVKNTLSRHFFMGNVIFTPRIGVDAGRSLMRGNSNGWQSNSGVSAGISMRYHKAFFDIETSRGWWHSDDNKKNEPVQVLGRIAYTF